MNDLTSGPDDCRTVFDGFGYVDFRKLDCWRFSINQLTVALLLFPGQPAGGQLAVCACKIVTSCLVWFVCVVFVCMLLLAR